MRLKLPLVFTAFVALLLASVSPCFALFSNDVDKAKEFMAAGMYPQAIELLKKRINDKPTDADAHFQLGISYVNTGNYGGADERFNRFSKKQFSITLISEIKYPHSLSPKAKVFLNKANTIQQMEHFLWLSPLIIPLGNVFAICISTLAR